MPNELPTPESDTLVRFPDAAAKHSTFSDTELTMVDAFLAGIRGCDPGSDHEFSNYMKALSAFFPLRMNQKSIAARLCVTPMTFQRWGNSQSLPYPVPRKAYLQEVDGLLSEVRERLLRARRDRQRGRTADVIDVRFGR